VNPNSETTKTARTDRRIRMNEKLGQSARKSDEQKPKLEESPSEKLEGDPPTGSLVPGSENPESEEIKEEKSPNSE
jgi:hypothetical protein